MRNSNSIIIFLFLAIFYEITVANTEDTVFILSSSLDNASLGESIEIFEDESCTLTIEDVIGTKIQNQFVTSNEIEPGFGFTSSIYWVKFNVSNPTSYELEWYLEIAYPLIDFIDLYVPNGNDSFITKKTGDRLPFDSREMDYRNFIFKLSENPESEKTYYLRFETSSSMNMPLNFWSRDALIEKITSEQFLLGIFFGAVIIMIIYNIFLFLGFGEVSYVYYVLFLTAWGFAQLTLNGLAFQHLWPDSIWWANINLPVLIFTTLFATIQFSRSLLLPGNSVPFLDKFLKYGNLFFLLSIGLAFIVNYAVSIRLATASSIVVVATLAFTGYISVRQGSRPARFFLTAWGFFFFGVILFALKSFGILEGNIVTNWSIQIGFFILMILFSIAVQDRVKLDKREKYLAQKVALENEQKLVQTLKESERILEEKVNERTKELYDKNASLTKTTEELKESAKELDTLNTIVKIINREVEFGNVMNALLEQGLKLFPQAQHGAALIFDIETERYQFVASVGYKLDIFKKSTITEKELNDTFSHISEEVVKGIYIIRQDKDPANDTVFNLTNSKSIMAMSISLEGQLAGFLLFDHNSKSDAFDRSDAQKLSRFRSHAISAFAKAKLLLEIMRINEEVFKTQDQLIVQEKMASLGQLTAGIAHEIKNPLNFVNNFAEGSVELTEELAETLNLLKENIGKDDFEELDDIISELKQNALDILDNGKRADSIVHSMMDHARDSKGERRFTDINSLVDENVSLAYHGYRAIDPAFNISIQKNYGKSLAKVEIIHTDAGRVLLNILSNACYAVMEKQKIEGETYSPELKISTKSVNGYMEIRIHDNGPGISQKVREKIFNPFFTTKPTGEGNTGLGLSISYDIIVQQHHGKLEVESEPGSFTEFLIGLPLSAKS
jgi:signal transduction histidine kinase